MDTHTLPRQRPLRRSSEDPGYRTSGHDADRPSGSQPVVSPSPTVVRPAVPRVVRANELPPEELRARVRQGDLVRVLRGIYAAPPPDGLPWEADRYLLLCRAAAVHATRRTEHWFSRSTAAVLWGCHLLRVPTEVDVTGPSAPSGPSGATPGVRRHWTERAVEVTTVLGLPATGLERTVLECASSLPPEHGIVVADSAARMGADPQMLADLVGRAVGDRGVRRARDVLALTDARAESAGESVLRYAIITAGIPAPDLQIPVHTRLGRFRVDLGWPEVRLAVEFDGRAKYGAAPESVMQALVAEKRRQEAIEDEGWQVLRFMWPDLAHPEDIAARIRRALRHGPRGGRA